MSLANTERLLDRTSWHILSLLQGNARMTYAEIGKKVGLTAPGVADRVRRLEDAGIITGYAATLNHKALGLGVIAFLRVKLARRIDDRIDRLIESEPCILEAHNVTGVDDFVLKVGVRDIEQLNALLEKFHDLGETVTSIVINSPLAQRVLGEAGNTEEQAE
jgi:Lrp/AsnC family leucine-responsive transcriptional regulator